MIQRILLVAAREYRQIAATRSFWVTLLILPLAFAIGPLASRFIDKSGTETVMLVDRTGGGGVAWAIADAIEVAHQRRVLTALSRYAQRHHLDRADARAPWASHDRLYGDAEVRRFVADGGEARATATMRRVAGDVPAFDAPERLFRIVPTPPAVAQAAPGRLDSALAPWLSPAEGRKRKAVDYVVLIPADFGASPAVRLWTNGQPGSGIVATLQEVLTRTLRTRYLAASGVAPATADAAASIAPAIAVTAPPIGGGRERVLIRSILPLACAYILLMSLVLSGSWMLQGSVEERSNKLIEALLACVSPNELMYGKLVGTVAIGLSMVATWAVCGLVAAFATHGAIAGMIRPALEPVSSLGSVATILYFFVMGYLMVSMIFLTIGAMSDSMRDAQGYLTPVILVIMMPFVIVMQAVLKGADGVGIHVMTWIPLYTPFVVLARLGSGLAWWEIVGSGALLAAFVALEIVLLGRVFRTSLLAAGQRASLGRLIGLIQRRA